MYYQVLSHSEAKCIGLLLLCCVLVFLDLSLYKYISIIDIDTGLALGLNSS